MQDSSALNIVDDKDVSCVTSYKTYHNTGHIIHGCMDTVKLRATCPRCIHTTYDTLYITSARSSLERPTVSGTRYGYKSLSLFVGTPWPRADDVVGVLRSPIGW